MLKDKQTDVSETETFQSSKLERDRDETESLGAFSLETETRPRVSPISATHSLLNFPFILVRSIQEGGVLGSHIVVGHGIHLN